MKARLSSAHALSRRSRNHKELCGHVSRHLKRLRVHGLIKRIGRRYKYYVTEIGRRAIIAGLKLRELFAFPQLAVPAAA